MWKIMNTRKTSNLMIYNLFDLEKICEKISLLETKLQKKNPTKN